MDASKIRVQPLKYLDFIVNEKSLSARPIYLNISNDSKQPAAFKLKTTSPEKLKVKTHLGFVKPGETVSIRVSLLKSHVTSVSTRDRLLVLVAFLTEEEINNGRSANDVVKGTPPTDVISVKLRCRPLAGFMHERRRNEGLPSRPRSRCTSHCLHGKTEPWLLPDGTVDELVSKVICDHQCTIISEQLEKLEADCQRMIRSIGYQTLQLVLLTTVLVALLVYMAHNKHLLPFSLSSLLPGSQCSDSWWGLFLESLGYGC